MGSTSFLGFSYPNLLLVLSEPVIPVSYFCRKCWDFLWVFFILCLFYFSVPYFGLLACDHGNSFLCLDRKKEKGTG